MVEKNNGAARDNFYDIARILTSLGRQGCRIKSDFSR